MFCTNCGKNIPDKSTICPVCNKEISIPKNDEIHFEKNCSAPLSTSVFFFMQIIFLIPIINIIFLIFWSFKKGVNLNQKSFSRSVLIWYISKSIILLFILLTLIVLRYPISLSHWFLTFKNFINTLPEI